VSFVRTSGLQVAIVLGSALVPLYVSLIAARDSTTLIEATSRWLRNVVLFTLPAAVILILFAVPVANLLGPGLSFEGRSALAVTLAGSAPLLIVLSIAGIGKALSDSYKLPAGYPILIGLMTLGTVGGTLAVGHDWKLFGAIVGLVAGSVCGLSIQVGLLYRRSPFRHRPESTLSEPQPEPDLAKIRASYKNVLWLLLSAGLISLQGVIERAYASQLTSGSIVALSLALSLVGVPTALLLPAISSVLLPHLSGAAGRSRKFGLSFFNYALLAGIFAVVTAVVWLYSNSIVRVLFLRGQFSTEAADLTAETMRWLSLSFVSYVVGVVFRQVLIARNLIRIDVLISASLLFVEILLLRYLVPAFGLNGIAVEMLAVSVLGTAMYGAAIRFSR
jgi:putative peptidoglycan lipid II flippase